MAQSGSGIRHPRAVARTLRTGQGVLAVVVAMVLALVPLVGPARPARVGLAAAPIGPDNLDTLAMVAQYGRPAPLAVAFAPDGSTLAIGTQAGLALWNPETLAEVAVLDPALFARRAAFSPDSSLLAVQGTGATVRVWSVATRELVAVLVPPGSESLEHSIGLAFSPDGAWLAAGGWARNVHLWRVTDWTIGLTVASDEEAGSDLAFSPDGQSLVVSGSGGGLRQWLLPEGTAGWVARRPDGNALDDGLVVGPVAFAPDGQQVVVGWYNGLLAAHDPATGAPIWTRVFAEQQAIRSVQFSPDGQTILALPAFHRLPDGVARLVRAADGGLVEVWGRDLEGVGAFTPDGQAVLLLSQRDGLGLYHPGDERPFRALDWYGGSATSLWPLPDGERTLAHHERAGADLELRRLSDGAVLARYPGVSWADAATLALSPDGALAAMVVRERVRLLRLEDGEVVRELPTEPPGIRLLAFSPDGLLLAGGNTVPARSGERTTAVLWNVADGSVARHLTGPRGPFRQLDFSPDGRLLAAVNSDGTTRLWDVADGSEVRLIPSDGKDMSAVRFSPDGRGFMTLNAADTLRMWSLGDEAPRWQRERLTSVLTTTRAWCFTPDSRLLVAPARTGFSDPSAVTFIRVADGALAGELTLPSIGSPTTLVLSPDGRTLTATSFGVVTRWEAR